MAPRTAGSSRAGPSKPKAVGKAAPAAPTPAKVSKVTAKAAAPAAKAVAKPVAIAAPRTSRKRAAEASPEVEDDEFAALEGDLEVSDEGEDNEEDEDEDEDEFPELDSGSELGDFEGDEDEGDDGEDEEDSDDELIDDEDDGSESGYNSSDIERMYGSSPESDFLASPSSGNRELSTDERLSRLIARNTVKPDDSLGAEGKLSTAKESKGKLVPSKLVPGGYRREYDDIEAGYGSESSTEDNPNTIGNIPIEWYDDMPHIGYDVDGRKIFRPAKGDELDKFLANTTDIAAWTSAEDKLLQKNVQLSDKELDIIRRLVQAENPDADFNLYQPTIEWFTGEGQERIMPLSAAPEPKRRFVPSKWEHAKVGNLV